MEKYIIRGSNGNTLEINGEPCLRQEYPDLQLFIGFYPCENKGKKDCYCPSIVHDCCTFRVCEITTGASLHPVLQLTMEDAIEAAKQLIEKVGVAEVELRIRDTLIKTQMPKYLNCKKNQAEVKVVSCCDCTFDIPDKNDPNWKECDSPGHIPDEIFETYGDEELPTYCGYFQPKGSGRI